MTAITVKCRIQRIMLAPKMSTLCLIVACGIAIGLIAAIAAGLLWLNPQPRLVVGGTFAVVVTLYGILQTTDKNRTRLHQLRRVLAETDKPKARRITTNPAKPGKTVRLSSRSEFVDIPEKRWKKLAPVLNIQVN